MKNILRSIPVALQHIILIRLVLAVLCLVVAACLFFQSRQLMIMAPFLLTALLMAGHGVYIGWLSLKGRCLVLKGTVLNVERSILRAKPKALLLEVEGTALRVALRDRIKAPAVGDMVSLYIPDDAPLYEWRGIHQLNSYFTLAVKRSSGNCPPHNEGP